MDLTLEKRVVGKKSGIKKLRREGGIPGVLYEKSGNSSPVLLKKAEVEAHLRKMKKGCLATQKFTLLFEGKKKTSIIKDIEYDRITYDILHIDLMEIDNEKEVTVNVPVLFKGEDACVGLTLGGQIKRIRRSVKVRMKASEIPEAFIVDVSNLKLNDSIRIKDLEVTKSMKINENKDQVLIAVSK